MNQAAKLLDALQSGESLTAKQIRNRIGAKNPHETVRLLRAKGYAIYCNKRTNSKGQTKNFYRLGTPSRSMVSGYYCFYGAQ